MLAAYPVPSTLDAGTSLASAFVQHTPFQLSIVLFLEFNHICVYTYVVVLDIKFASLISL